MRVAIIGAPLDLGADRRGVDMGSSAIRYAGLETRLRDAGHEVRDFGNLSGPVRESEPAGASSLKYLDAIVRTAGEIADTVAARLKEGWLPLVLGGDHSVSLGTVTGVTRNRSVGLIWLDAHGDFNTPETTPSGNIHGMVLAALAGYGDDRLTRFDGRRPKVDPHNVAIVGVRELDPGERALLLESSVQAYSMHDIDRLGLPRVIELVLDHMSERVEQVHVSLDIDVVDPLQAPGVGTPVLGGLSYRETHLALEVIAAARRTISMDVVEVNPILDTRNETARLAVEFILSALGKRIL